MTKKILFVDDDLVLLEFYRVIMGSEKSRWEVTTEQDANRALDLLGQTQFDVLVSDLQMPGIDGFQFMREVSQRYPRPARITVSGRTDQEEAARCLGTTHQFLAKPFDIKSFRATLARVSELHSLLGDTRLQTFVSKLGTLPSFPSLYLEIMVEIEKEESSLEGVAEIVSKDPAMTAKLLQIVNSAAFARARKMATPLEAIQFLGVSTLHSLVLSAHVFSCFDQKLLPEGFSMQSLWKHAVETALLSRLILQSEGADTEQSEAAYTSGLLHDVGKLMLAQSMPVEFRTAVHETTEKGIPLFEAESKVFGATHAGVGAYLLGLWGLPAAIVEAVAFHHTPSQTNLRELSPLTAVHVANALLGETKQPVKSDRASKLDLEYLAGLGLKDHLDHWRSLSQRTKSPAGE